MGSPPAGAATGRTRPLHGREVKRRPRVIEAENGEDALPEGRRKAEEAAADLLPPDPPRPPLRPHPHRLEHEARGPAAPRPAARERHDEPVSRRDEGQPRA